MADIAVNCAGVDADVMRLVEGVIALMKDNEGEVRRAIAKQLPLYSKLIKDLKIVETKIISVVNELSQDPHENVRAALASAVTGLSPILPRQSTIDKLLPIFLKMLKDDFPDVRLNIISNLSIVNESIGMDLLSTSLLPAITELAQDNKWRVRLAIIEYIPKLANQLGESFFNNELLTLCMSWLWDPVFVVREAAVNNLKELTVIFGSSWAEEHIITRLLNINDDRITEDEGITIDQVDFSNFIIRITCLFAFTKLVPVVDPALLVDKILPFINPLSADSVPNIRFNVAKSYATVVEVLLQAQYAELPKVVADNILPNLVVLLNDSDVDVVFYAKESIAKIKQMSNAM